MSEGPFTRRAVVGAVAVAALAALFALVRPSAPPPLRVGAPAPDFRLPQLDGERPVRAPGGGLSLAETHGKVVFVNFWATWCPPCRDEAPSLQRLYERLGSRGLEILAVTIDDAGDLEAVAKFRQELGLTLPILLDPDRDVYRAYQATGVPETFVVSREGRLVERVVGPRDWDEPRFAALVERLLGGDSAPGAGAPGMR